MQLPSLTLRQQNSNYLRLCVLYEFNCIKMSEQIEQSNITEPEDSASNLEDDAETNLNVNTDLNTSNLNADEIDSRTLTKLRGDAIGDTMYSQSFVIRTLLQLKDLHWCEEAEEDFCSLWDMTVEKDVCNYLHELSFISIACDSLVRYDEPRFVEIIIGTIANICSTNCNVQLPEGDVSVILNSLDTDDYLILIQMMRFIKAVVHRSTGEIEFVNEEILSKILFVLRNSVYKDLLKVTLDVVHELTTDLKLRKEFVNVDLLASALTANETLNKLEGDNNTIEDDTTNNLIENLVPLLRIVVNVCCYFEIAENRTILGDINDFIVKLAVKFEDAFEFFSRDIKSSSTNEEFFYFVNTFNFVYPILNVPLSDRLFPQICEIINNLIDDDDVDMDPFVDCMRFVISSRSCEQLKSDIQNSDYSRCLKFVLNYTGESKCEFEHKINYILHENCE